MYAFGYVAGIVAIVVSTAATDDPGVSVIVVVAAPGTINGRLDCPRT